MAPATGWAKPQAETSVFGPDNYMPNIIFQAWHWCFVTFSFLSWILQGWGVGQWGDEERKIQALTLRFLSQLCWANQTLANQSVVCWPVTSASPGSWLEMQGLRPCPRPSTSESAFLLNPHLAPVHVKVGEADAALLNMLSWWRALSGAMSAYEHTSGSGQLYTTPRSPLAYWVT